MSKLSILQGHKPAEVSGSFFVFPPGTAVFGWKITKWESPQEYWLVETGDECEPGINGDLYHPNETFLGAVNTLAVPDIGTCIEKIKQHGGVIAAEKHAIPGIG